MKIHSSLESKGPHQAGSIVKQVDITGDRSSRSSSVCIHEQQYSQIVVTGSFPPSHQEAGGLVEVIRDPENASRTAFLECRNGTVKISQEIRHGGRIFVPPDPTSHSFPGLSLPIGLSPCGKPSDLLADISSTISRFVKLRPDQLLIVTAFVLASWFPDCFEAAPYLWIVGPLGSAKTKLLKLLSCLCRRGLIVGDLRSGSLYQLIDAWNPTLLIDELDLGNSGANSELFRMLRAGSVPGVPVVRNGVPFSIYSLKVIASRQPLADPASDSRGIVVPMLPTEIETEVLDEVTMQEIEKNFQPRLCDLRVNNYAAVKSQYVLSPEVQSLSPRIKQIARALLAPLLGEVGLTCALVQILSEHDSDSRIARSLEPEWLVAESLFALCHEGMESGRLVSEILVGGVAAHVNNRLRLQGEGFELTAKKVGLVLSSLGISASRLGRMGRGLKLTAFVKGKIHEIAGSLGINRRNIATSAGLEAGYGGAPCELCEKFELLGGLHFSEAHRSFRQDRPSSQRGPLFPKKDEEDGSPITLP